MARGLLQKTRDAGEVVRDPAGSRPYSLDIEIDEREGLVRIYDPRAFHDGRRGFCRRLLEAAADSPALEKAEVDLDAASCRLEFDRRRATSGSMAEAVAAAVHRAAATAPADDGARWWSRGSRWSTLTAYRTSQGISWWETLDARPGRIRLRHEGSAGDRSRLARLPEGLAALDGIDGGRVSTWSGTVTIDYGPESPVARRLLDAVELALRDGPSPRSSGREIAARRGQADDRGIAVATGLRRLRYLALAGGSFAMSFVGLVVPGIPTVPFLLATSYYLARSSPRLNDRLRRTALFGPILEEWDDHRGLSRSSKARLVGLTAVIVVVTVSLGAGSPVALVVILVIALASLYAIARLPGVPDDEPGAPGRPRAARLALPSR